MKFATTIGCLLGLILSQAQAQAQAQYDDLCILGPHTGGGGQYEYKGVDSNGKPYWQQKECIRTYEQVEGQDPIKMAGNYILSFVDAPPDVFTPSRWYIGTEVGVVPPYLELYCFNWQVRDSPLDCKAWVFNNNVYTFGIYSGSCPDVLGEDIANDIYNGINVKFPDNYADGDIFNGDYNEIGLNMFKKVESTLSNPIYLYFDPYYVQWRFIGSTTEDEKSWIGQDPDNLTCPTYSLVDEPYAESLGRRSFPRIENINEVFQQFSQTMVSYQVPLPFYYPNNTFDPEVKATEFMTLTALKA